MPRKNVCQQHHTCALPQDYCHFLSTRLQGLARKHTRAPRLYSPLCIWLAAHFEYQRAARHNLFMIDVTPIERSTVQSRRLDIDIHIRKIICDYSEMSFSRYFNRQMFEMRSPDYINATGRIHGIESHRAQNIPG